MVQAQIRSTLRRLIGADIQRSSDAELVTQFVEYSNSEAFAELVRRHGPMVLGLCRRALNDSHAADDAFQATFLVLARKAAGIATRATVGNWLFGVAARTAARAKSRLAQQRTREIAGADMTTIPGRPETDSAQAELLARLNEAVATLPEKYRVAVVLCELEGRSLKEVAENLGVPQGTVASRLARGRELLATRLRRSVPAASVAVVAGMMTNSASAVPPCLLDLVVRSACDPSIASASVLSLTQGVIRSMLLTKTWTLATLGGTLALLAGVATVAVTAGENPAPPTAKTSDAGKEKSAANTAVLGGAKQNETVSLQDLREIGVAYLNYLTLNPNKAPQNLKELETGLPEAKEAFEHLKNKRVEFYYGVTIRDMPAGTAKTILAHERDAAKNGGLVLLGDGSVLRLTAEEFSKYTIVKAKK